jgi:hypothetical protein
MVGLRVNTFNFPLAAQCFPATAERTTSCRLSHTLAIKKFLSITNIINAQFMKPAVPNSYDRQQTFPLILPRNTALKWI